MKECRDRGVQYYSWKHQSGVTELARKPGLAPYNLCDGG